MTCVSAMPRTQVTSNEIKDVTIRKTDQLKTVKFVFEPFSFQNCRSVLVLW